VKWAKDKASTQLAWKAKPRIYRYPDAVADFSLLFGRNTFCS
jgi:hypothetical protein